MTKTERVIAIALVPAWCWCTIGWAIWVAAYHMLPAAVFHYSR
jgi:hypothetical protein